MFDLWYDSSLHGSRGEVVEWLDSRRENSVLNWPSAERVLLSIPIPVSVVSVAAKLASSTALLSTSAFSVVGARPLSADKTDMTLFRRGSSFVNVTIVAVLFGAKCMKR